MRVSAGGRPAWTGLDERPHLAVSDSVIWLSVSVRWARIVAGAEQRRSSRCQWFGHLAVSGQGGPVGSWLVDGPGREAVVRRLAALEDTGRLGSQQVRLAGGALGVSERTMWRWVRQARGGEGLSRRPRGRFRVTDEIRQRLAFWRGNAAAVHRELAATAKAGGPPAPSLSTLQRAVVRDVLAGDRAGLAGGERARRAYDVFLQRPGTHRNAVWEADHVEVPVEVDAAGRWTPAPRRCGSRPSPPSCWHG